MSFKNYKDKIDEGDTVILYLSNNVHAIEVRPEIKNKKGDLVENVFQTTFGALKVKNLIGVEYGSRVELSKGWGHVLQPTPELWSVTLPHRTQIIYTPDISMILLQLDLVPGCVVIEAGTGSGSLTHALIRRVRPHGHVHTFDFHEHRAKIARDEFEAHGIAEYVTAKHRDVLEQGFGEELNGKADAVFLDLPAPWLGVPHAVAAMKENGGRFCSFSPCIEQVQRTCLALTSNGFQELATMEVLQTEVKVTRRTIPVRDLSFLKHKGSENPVDEKPTSDTSYVVGGWPPSAPGHTGYLTVATLPPLFLRDKKSKAEVSSNEKSVLSENDAAKEIST
ncbi:tRNA (adenine(58)-N(1))-methyltransferase catalytic subunit TRMT61A [Leguminivora glycinivorella]|uniref:tRNA (adenine(58)-N(1))-methyltransferase catalytic subunit TRMT61A n=1 Tax=Leguminivora glycinivorella TaxID=1035111 RepID=UPI00200E77BE|nr:tRNA (adenine(58)-N(1))-methyltransferase catalytic subunit TRMT61A [Leguminivora glycinivorella]